MLAGDGEAGQSHEMADKALGEGSAVRDVPGMVLMGHAVVA